MLWVQLGQAVGHTAEETSRGSGAQHPQSYAQRGGTPPAVLWGSCSPTRAHHTLSHYLRFRWPLADGLKKRAGSKEGDMGPKCMARGRGRRLMLGDIGWKGVGDVYPVVWKGKEN